MPKYNTSEIKKLINDDLDLELISFKLDIPLDELEKIKKDIEVSNRSKTNGRISKTTSGQQEDSYAKLQQIRKKYYELIGESDTKSLRTQRELTEEELEITDSIIANIETIVEEATGRTINTRREKAQLILAEVDKIKKYPLTMEQLEKINFLMSSDVLKGLKAYSRDTIGISITKTRRTISGKSIDSIDIAQSQTDNIEELQNLKRKITPEIIKLSPIMANALKSRIENKIIKIRQKAAIDKIRNDIPPCIHRIIKQLVNGTLDIEKANEIIDKETKKKIKTRPKNNFSLNQEQVRNQILMQINVVLIDKATEYKIKNPEKTIVQLQELCGDNLEKSISTVVRNFISNKKFADAKDICEKYSGDQERISTNLSILRKEIINAEISELVLKVINMKAPKKECACFEVLEKRLKSGNINRSAIYLGKNKDNSKNITLADVWPDEIQK